MYSRGGYHTSDTCALICERRSKQQETQRLNWHVDSQQLHGVTGAVVVLYEKVACSSSQIGLDSSQHCC